MGFSPHVQLDVLQAAPALHGRPAGELPAEVEPPLPSARQSSGHPERADGALVALDPALVIPVEIALYLDGPGRNGLCWERQHSF